MECTVHFITVLAPSPNPSTCEGGQDLMFSNSSVQVSTKFGSPFWTCSRFSLRLLFLDWNQSYLFTGSVRHTPSPCMLALTCSGRKGSSLHHRVCVEKQALPVAVPLLARATWITMLGTRQVEACLERFTEHCLCLLDIEELKHPWSCRRHVLLGNPAIEVLNARHLHSVCNLKLT